MVDMAMLGTNFSRFVTWQVLIMAEFETLCMLKIEIPYLY